MQGADGCATRTGTVGLKFPLRGALEEYDVAVDENGRAHAEQAMDGLIHKIVISIDDYLDGMIQSFDMFYTYDPNGPENASIREHLGLEWHGEVLMMIRWPGLADPNADEDEYGEFDYSAGKYIDAPAYMEYEAEIDNGEENAKAAASMFNIMIHIKFSDTHYAV